MNKPFSLIAILAVFIFATQAFAQNQQAIDFRNQGLASQKSGQIESAISFYQRAIEVDPTYATAYNDLGIIYEERGNTNEAQRYYENAIAVNPAYASSYSNLAALFESLGKYDQAKVYWQKRSQLGGENDPWRKLAQEKLSKLNSGQSYSEKPIRKVQIPRVVSNESKIRTITQEAKSEARMFRFDKANELLNQAREIDDKSKLVNETYEYIRNAQIDYNLASSEREIGFYKRELLNEVESHWWPPSPDEDAKNKNKSLKSLNTRSASRKLIEEKAKQIIPSIDFTDARLKDVVEFLAVSNDLNIVIDESVVVDEYGVTIKLKNIPLNEALDIILRTKGLKYRFEDNIVWITSAEKLAQEELEVKVYDVQDLVGKLHDFPAEPFNLEETITSGGSDKGQNAEE